MTTRMITTTLSGVDGIKRRVDDEQKGWTMKDGGSILRRPPARAGWLL